MVRIRLPRVSSEYLMPHVPAVMGQTFRRTMSAFSAYRVLPLSHSSSTVNTVPSGDVHLYLCKRLRAGGSCICTLQIPILMAPDHRVERPLRVDCSGRWSASGNGKIGHERPVWSGPKLRVTPATCPLPRAAPACAPGEGLRPIFAVVDAHGSSPAHVRQSNRHPCR